MSSAVMRWLWALPLFFFVSCSDWQKGPPLRGACHAGTITLTVKLLSSEADIKAARLRLLPRISPDAKVLGFATKGPEPDHHTLWVVAPSGINDHERIETWGHELMHAMCGAWHG